MQFAAFRDLTRFEQTLFGLPFIFAGVILASYHYFDWRILSIVVLAFMLARISGMSFNQLIDRHIDARNPRTVNRALPSGRVTQPQARTVAWGALILFIVLCLQMNKLTASLSCVAAPLLYLYSYMKRVHASCHVVLACIHFLGPVMAYTALLGRCDLCVVFLGGVAAFSILGTDILYAIQDYDFDCSVGLYSIPSRLGLKKSIHIAQIAHGMCLLMAFCVGWRGHLTLIYYGAIPCLGIIFWFFHSRVYKHLKKNSLSMIEPYFFVSTIAVSGSIFLFIFVSRIWAVLL